ncbi:MAG: clostripain-related cysteine peptidase, partial [Acidobacteriota bacterium]
MARQKTEKQKKEWLVMIYLSGDNDLSEESVWSLLEVLRAGPSDEVGVVVQIDPRFQGIRRFDLAKLFRGKGKKLRSNVAAHRDEVRSELLSRGRRVRARDNMATVKALKEFIIESKKPPNEALRHLLILSGHGGGPTGSSFLVDQFPAHGVSMKGVRNAIKAAGGVDVVGMDSCGMGMAEIGDQLSDCADFLVASEGFELNTGWPYFPMLEKLKKTPEMDARTLAATIVQIHTDYYSNYLMAGVSTDMAACDLQKAPDLTSSIKELARELTRNLLLRQRFAHKADLPRDKRVFVEDLRLAKRSVADAIILAHWRAQSYRFERHTDLYDFCDLLDDGCRDEGVSEDCKKVKSIIKGKKTDDGTYDGYVIKSCHSGGMFQHSHGVAVYFPWAAVDKDYSKLSLSQKAGWDLFLKAYVRRTRRRPRDDSGVVELVAQADESSAMRDFPELGTKDFPELGTKDFPELGTKDFPELGTKDFPELGTK